jgi:hypothetical protein
MLTTPATSAHQDFLFWGVVTKNCVSTNLRSHFGSSFCDSRQTWPSGLSGLPGLLLWMASGAHGRRELVKCLRKAAKDCGLPSAQLPRDTASRDKVQELARQAAASNGSAQDKAKAAQVFTAYEATWPAAEDSGEESEDEKTFRLRGTSFLLTYN